jgi:hypothetical protein
MFFFISALIDFCLLPVILLQFPLYIVKTRKFPVQADFRST